MNLSAEVSLKFMDNQDKYEGYEEFSLQHAKALHSYIHNLVEAYKLDDHMTIVDIWDEIFLSANEWGEMKHQEFIDLIASKINM